MKYVNLSFLNVNIVRALSFNVRNSFIFQEDKGIYNSKVKAMIEDGKVRIVVNVNDLRAKNPVRAKA